MEKVWSFNTTLRNPERIQNMLRALSELEGTPFDDDGQRMFFSLQIKKRLYRPTVKTLVEPELIQIVEGESGDDIDDDLVERIVSKYDGKSVDGAGRGRTSAGVMNRFGLCVAKDSKGRVIISDLAKKWLKNEIDDEELFTHFFLKWQYPNQIELGYNDFNIKPFIGLLNLISKLNEGWSNEGYEPVGISKEEYRLFVPSLIKYTDINEYVRRIITYRLEKKKRAGKLLSDYMRKFEQERVAEIFGSTKDFITALSDLRDYTDSSIRYFRMSGLIVLRGNDTHIDIAKDKFVEVNSILNSMHPSADNFDSDDEYYSFLSNIKAINLPWKNNNDLEKIVEERAKLLKKESNDISNFFEEIDQLTVEQKVERLDKKLNEVRLDKLRNIKHDINVLEESILGLEKLTQKNYEPITSRPSLDLEWFVSRALMVINDATSIEPSYNLGDDGIPTGFRSNTADIKCNYESFSMAVEVTLLVGRDQWIAEGQPVMRHLRDFEDQLPEVNMYCLFIAPHIHRDTLNTFWLSDKFEYEGKKQKIIPITILQFIEILKLAKAKIESDSLNHKTLDQLFSSFMEGIETVNNCQEWIVNFPNITKNELAS